MYYTYSYLHIQIFLMLSMSTVCLLEAMEDGQTLSLSWGVWKLLWQLHYLSARGEGSSVQSANTSSPSVVKLWHGGTCGGAPLLGCRWRQRTSHVVEGGGLKPGLDHLQRARGHSSRRATTSATERTNWGKILHASRCKTNERTNTKT